MTQQECIDNIGEIVYFFTPDLDKINITKTRLIKIADEDDGEAFSVKINSDGSNATYRVKPEFIYKHLEEIIPLLK